MTDPRLSTVYDYSNLRLHPDGTRVYQKSSNLRPHLAKITSQDPRSNWIARDAGGSGKIPEFRKPLKDQSEGPDEEPEPGRNTDDSAEKTEDKDEIDEQLSDEEDDSENEGGKRKLKQHIIRKLKRQKFAADYDYLQDQCLPFNDSHYSSDATNLRIVEQGLPEPSADLLKYIHRFSSEFYTERGQLLNISRQFRKERRKRQLQKLVKRERQVRRTKARESDSPSGSSVPDSSEEEENSSEKSFGGISEEADNDKDEDQEGEKEDQQQEEQEESEESTPEEDEDENGDVKKKFRNDRKGKGKAKPKGSRRAEQLYTDMYKMFDGSAIMALGMLIQETIAQMLDPEMPGGWKEEMENVYGGPGSDEKEDEERFEGGDEGDEDKDEGDEGDDEDEDDDESEGNGGDVSDGEQGKTLKLYSITKSDDNNPRASSHSNVNMKAESGLTIHGLTQTSSDESHSMQDPVEGNSQDNSD